MFSLILQEFFFFFSLLDKVMVTTYETQIDENGEPGLNEEANAAKKTIEDEGNC